MLLVQPLQKDGFAEKYGEYDMTNVLYDYVQKEPAVTKYDQHIRGVLSAEDSAFYVILICGLLLMLTALT
jgi:hypothetical protein